MSNYRNRRKARFRKTASYKPHNIAVAKLYLSHVNNKGILIKSITKGFNTENKIPLKLEHPDNFGFLQLNYKGPKFYDYFPPDSTVKVKEILLKKSSTIHGDVHDGSWKIIHIITEKKSDCHYLWKNAIEAKYTVILAIQIEVIDANNSLRQLTLFPHNKNGTPLHRAVAKKDMKIIRTLLECKLNINARNKKGWTALHVAVNLELFDIVDLLIIKGADVNAQNRELQVPLHYAVTKNNLEILDSLLKRQVKFNKTDQDGQTPLHYAVKAGNGGAVDILLKKGANYKLEDKFNRTAFNLAAERLNLDIIKVFLKNNVDANILNSVRRTPLFYASFHRQPNDVHKETYLKVIDIFLKKGANINFQDSEGYAPLYYAMLENNTFMEALLEYNAKVNTQDVSGKNVLHLACQLLKNNCVQTFLNYDIDINAVDKKGKTAIHVAVEARNCRAIKLILEKNPNINIVDRDGNTALHLALKSGRSSIIELLLKNKADVNLKDSSGKTALHISLGIPNISINIVKSILESTNDINATDSLGRTATHYAALNYDSNTVIRLLEEKAGINAKDSKTMNPGDYYFKCMEAFLDAEPDMNADDDNLTSPFNLGCLIKNVEVVKYLIENGADSSMRDNDKEIISVNCVDKFGKTPLHYAAEDNNPAMSKLFLHFGADLNILDKDHYSPFSRFIEQTSLTRYYHWSTEPIATIYKRHVIKMKLLKLWVRESILNKINEVKEIYVQLDGFSESACSREVDLMKSTNLEENNITYYDFLKKSPHDAVNFTRNHNVVNTIQSNELIKTFPMYFNFLKSHLREAQRRSFFYEKIEESLKTYIFEKLPTPCMSEIFRYLNDSDLTKFLKAIKPAVLLK